MDPTEDLSARVLLKHILSTEQPRTPITRSASQTQSTSATRSSKRLRKQDAGAQTPQDMLRRSLKNKMRRESITRKSLPATKRRTASFVQRKINTPAATSVLFDDGDTPRHILMNILRTEPTKSPVVHENVASEEPQPSPANSSITRKSPSIELLDLPDITIANAVSTGKGLSRKRPRRSLNVTAFEKRLKEGEDVEEESEVSMDNHSSLSLSSSTSLSLKTPFGDVRTEKKGLKRRVSNRRKISEEEFGAAVNKRQTGGVSSFVQAEQGLSETAYSEGFTLGLSKLSEPDITTDILHCNTALYAQPDAMTSNFSIIATQDKPTVMASQLQRQMEEEEEVEEEQMEVEEGKLGKEKSTYAFPTEEGAEPQDEVCFSQSEEDADAAESQEEEEESPADGQLETASAVSEEEEGSAESQTGVRDDTAESEDEENKEEAGDSQTEEDAAVNSQTEAEEEEGGVNSQPEEDAAPTSTSEEEEVVPDTQTEDVAVNSQTEEEEEEEEAEDDSQPEEDVAPTFTSEEEEVVPDTQMKEDDDEGAIDSQTEEEGAVDLQPEEDVAEARSQSEEEEDVADDLADSQPEEEYDRKQNEEDVEEASEQQEHISRRAQRSEGGLIMPVIEAEGDLADATDAGWSDGKSKAHSSLELGSPERGQLHSGIPDLAESSQGQTEAEPDADKENSYLLEGMHDVPESRDLNDEPTEEAAAQDSAEQEEEREEAEEEEEYDDDDDEEENDEFPSKTPAFVRQKIHFLQTDQPASPSVFKNIQPSSGESDPQPKRKQVRQRKTGPSKTEVALPKSYVMSVFKHFAKTKVSADVYPVLKEIMDKYFDRMAEDLEAFALHAKRKTIEVEDAELLLRRQGHVNDKVPVEVLIEKYLRMDQRRLLIPIATSGNVVVPKMRR
ncbi:protein IWS1 homolog isoform X2 [Centropristis striata]|uniref:protein IWS1 homolog isoform X2 n=1 Tax=Centropristis striata TaxID=184440 RepID=UPI0027DFE39F|nr:protein IWS1 homolog isoform X2 [Centropristis striata]